MKTTVVGSYPVPSWLRAYPSEDNLQDALLTVMKTQELAGLDLLADGELSRFDVDHPDTNGMIEHFVAPLDGIGTDVRRAERESFQRQAGMGFRRRPAAVVRGPLGPGRLDLPQEWERVKGLSERPIKFTLTSPYMLSKTLLDQHYGDPRALAMALAEILAEQVAALDAPVVQIDEANLTGHPEDAAWAHEVIQPVLDAVQNESALHLCFGNYGGRSIQRGTWSALLSFLGRLEVGHLELECARRDPAELSSLAELPASIGLGIGVVDIKDNETESPETVARRIEDAARRVGAERIAYVHPDCGFWMLPRSVADGKMRALVAGRDLYLGA